MKGLILLTLVILVLGVHHGYAQPKTFQFEEIDSLQNENSRLVAIFIHTDWCKYCAAMENTTFANMKVTSLLDNNYYFVDLNAEEKRNIKLGGHVFSYKPSGNNTGIHELAEQLGTVDNKVSYPTLSFLNENNEIVFQHNQYMSASDLEYVLKKLLDSY